MQNLLLELQQISTKLYELTVADSDTLIKAKKIKRTRPPKRDVFPVVKLDIPAPDSLVLELVRIGTPRAIAQELVEIYTRLASEVAVHHERIYHEECLSVLNTRNINDDDNDDFVNRSKIYSHLQRASHRLFIQRTQIWEKDLKGVCRDYYAARCVPSDIPQKKNSYFKLSFVPILEKVFKRNRFPSSAVKGVLAEKSGMSMKQIKDWFQNHRNRSKVSTNSGVSSPACPSRVPDARSIFSTDSPSYAYPTRYSPLVPREMDFTAFRNIDCWLRKPSNCNMKHRESSVDIASLVSDFEKMRISKLSPKLKGVTRRLKSHIKKKSTYSATFPYTIPDTRIPKLPVSKSAASTLQEKRLKGPCRKKSLKISGFFRVSRRVSQAPELDFGAELVTPNTDGVETVSVEREETKDRSSFVERDAYSPTPNLSKSESYSPPGLLNVLSPSLPNLSYDTQTVFDSDSLPSIDDSLVAVDQSLNSVNFCPELSLGEPFNIVSAYDILPVMPKFSDSIESITVDFFPLRNFQYPIITF